MLCGACPMRRRRARSTPRWSSSNRLRRWPDVPAFGLDLGNDAARQKIGVASGVLVHRVEAVITQGAEGVDIRRDQNEGTG
jgi:hypothetical protein